ncbi:PQQ-dependent sugar dehydrogenase [Wenjunlia tyrosinilytica]|uniref:Oxidoreductase n=1 Tax=Wenjunlia tyrosinilytica TaxID=1544741 RepID=A0A918DZ66_9ACTN|nr:PQQ-dependent sugar dehydrogenase [Wenjunlia tyrosinilytica]GGO93016.1 oxidoreductase [Wenjunlia tyrosinilytica]
MFTHRAVTRRVLTAVAVAVLVAVTGCSGGGSGANASRSPAPGGSSPGSSPSASSPSRSPDSSTPSGRAATIGKVSRVTEDLNTPWGLAFLPDGSALAASRDTGKVVRVGPDGRKQDAGKVPGVVAQGEGGLLGLAVAPTYTKDHWVYAYFTAAGDNRIVRMKYEDGRLGTPSTVITGIPKGSNHNGGRIAFGPDGLLYAGTGERYQRELAQDEKSLGGKILRMKPDGSVPPGNPFPDSVIYSYGHRNVQGLTWDGDGHLWASEFGQNNWDELNLIKPGKNYGWPVVEGVSDKPADKAKYVNPVAVWHTDDASPSGVAFADGAVWMASLRGERLWRIPISGEKAGKPKAFLTGTYGRLRTVVRAKDGTLWLTTSNTDGRGRVRSGDDLILRLTLR